MKVGQNLDNARREMFAKAALKVTESTDEGSTLVKTTVESRVDATSIREAIVAALNEGDLSLRTFSSGSVGTRVALKITVANDEGEEFDLTGSVLLTVPETVVKK